MSKPKPRAHEHQPTKDGRIPTLLRLRLETIQTFDALAEDAETSRNAMIQRALDEWVASETEVA